MKYCTLIKQKFSSFTIHVITSPEEGESVNSVIIETKNHLVLLDAPLLAPYGQEYKDYALSLGKRIDRLIISHEHPDHWFCAGMFADETSLMALPGTIQVITSMKELQVGYHTQIHGDLMPSQIQVPNVPIEVGPFELDGVVFNVFQIEMAEGYVMLGLDIPAEKVLFAQDLVYNKMHMYTATRSEDKTFGFSNWKKCLESLKTKNYQLVVPGHGELCNSSAFDEVLFYLQKAEETMVMANSADEYKMKMKETFTDYGTEMVLEMTSFMLFNFYPAQDEA